MLVQVWRQQILTIHNNQGAALQQMQITDHTELLHMRWHLQRAVGSAEVTSHRLTGNTMQVTLTQSPSESCYLNTTYTLPYGKYRILSCNERLLHVIIYNKLYIYSLNPNCFEKKCSHLENNISKNDWLKCPTNGFHETTFFTVHQLDF